MSMTTLVILRFAGIFAAYTGLTVLLPAIMFRRILAGRGLSEQFLMCYTFGNFYIINIVFAVQLLHISGFWALVLFTAVPGILIWSRVNRVSLRELCIKTGIICKKILQGSMGMRGALYRVCNRIKAVLKRSVRLFYYKVICNTLQWILVGAVIIALFWIYGRNLLLTYGYCASDIPVHLNWINEMVRGNLFSDGVYPFGFHCMIYYLHTVFRVDTYAILCVFYLVQVFFIHMVLLAVMKLLCRSLYLPYAGVLVYILGNLWAKQTYSRFGASLPQEFGMIFVIPSVYFLISFFQTEKEKLKTRETKLLSGCFALAFSLTLAIHFYGTMIAGLCCIGIAVGFCPRFLNKEYFKRIMMTGIISVFLAVLPMGIAFAGGTPLQGSLGWGLSVINGGKSDTEDEVLVSKNDNNQQTTNIKENKKTNTTSKKENTNTSKLDNKKENNKNEENKTDNNKPSEKEDSHTPGLKSKYLKKLSLIQSQVDNIDYGDTTYEMKYASSQVLKLWDDALNEIYGVLKSRLSSSEMNSLRQKQRAWISYRNKAADKEAAEYEGGTMEGLIRSEVLGSLTKDRCYELVNQYLK